MDINDSFLSDVDTYHDDITILTLELYKCEHISDRKGVTEIIELFNNFITNSTLRRIEKSFEKIQKKVAVESQSYNDFVDEIELILFENKNPFKNFITEEKRFDIYRKECGFLDPIQFTASLRDDGSKNTQVPVKAVHLSLAYQLTTFLEIPGVFNDMQKYEEKINQKFEERRIYSNIIHGNLWQTYYKPKYENKIVKPVCVFFDDVESGNALGSHAGGQKLGCVYASLPTLPPHLRSKLKNILLTTIFYSKNRGISKNEVFRKVIDELNVLSQDGLIVNIEGEPKRIYFQCVSLLGDNLGLNQACGFESSFNAEHFCRRCTLAGVLCGCLPHEVPDSLRTVRNYEEDLENFRNGIKSRCIFNDIIDFHIGRNPSSDIMHDVFEGMAVYLIEGVLTLMILVQEEITLQEVNEAIKNFNYGSLESKNMPQPLDTESCSEDPVTGLKRKIKCKQSASEMACLSRYLSLMIGDNIKNRENEYWKLYLKFRQIIGKITAPTFVIADIYESQELIEEFLTEFIRLLRNLPPKGHIDIFTHLIELLLLLGPLIHLWSMPIERKNRDIKLVASGTSSNKNIPYTVAVSNQLYMCYLKKTCANVGSKLELGTVIQQNADTDFKTKHTYAKGVLNAKKFSYLKINGKLYESGTVILIEAKENPLFGIIKSIYQAKGHTYFSVKLLETITFDTYYHAYNVRNFNSCLPEDCLINTDDLPEVEPCVIHTNSDGTFVATRYDL